MPDLDAVSMATPAADHPVAILFTVPADWSDDDYVAFIEVNTEGDYNATYNDQTFPTPTLPEAGWDGWAINSGYPYRGQPSVVYRVPFRLSEVTTSSAAEPAGHGDVSGFGDAGGTLYPPDDTMSDAPGDPTTAGSGADRLRHDPQTGARFSVTVQDVSVCATDTGPGIPGGMAAGVVADQRHSHEWGTLHFIVPDSARPIDHYVVRYSQTAIIPGNDDSFTRAMPAIGATVDSEGLRVPVGQPMGAPIEVSFGGMYPLTHYWVAIRAVDDCNQAGPFTVAELTTTRINFTQLSGCFVATAAYGSAMQPDVGALRIARDALRARSGLFSAATELYYQAGPAAAAVLAQSDVSRAAVRILLAPIADLARDAFSQGVSGAPQGVGPAVRRGILIK